MKWSRFRSLYTFPQTQAWKLWCSDFGGNLDHFMLEFGEMCKGIEISTTSWSDFSNLSHSFCFGFLPMAAHRHILWFAVLYDDFVAPVQLRGAENYRWFEITKILVKLQKFWRNYKNFRQNFCNFDFLENKIFSQKFGPTIFLRVHLRFVFWRSGWNS